MGSLVMIGVGTLHPLAWASKTDSEHWEKILG